MKNFKQSFVAIAVVVATILSLVGCSDMYEDTMFIKGDKVQVVPGDTIIQTDTVFVEKVVEIITDKTKDYVCYDFTVTGNIEGHTKNHAEMSEFSYNFTMESLKEVFFTEEQEKASFSVSGEASFDANSIAILQVSNGKEKKNISVMVPGSYSVIINSKEIYPCEPFKLVAEYRLAPNQTIDGKEYEVAVVTYTFINGIGEAVASDEVWVYSPVKEEEPEEPVNEQTVNISYEEDNDNLIITGRVDNTIDDDEIFTVKIPLILTLSTETRKVVNGQNLNFSVGVNPSEVSNNVVNNFSKEDGALSVTYNEFESVYSHIVTASGNDVELKQDVKYYNTFVATLYGERVEINLPVSLNVEKTEKGNEVVNNGTISCLYNINYTASQSSLTASATQEVEIVVSAISFEGEKVLWANRTVTFDALQSPKVYDCVVTSVMAGGNNFRYREVFADGSKGAWVSESLSSSNFDFISSGMKNNNSALAIYNHKNVDGPRVGYLRDFLSNPASQIIYFAYDCPQSTFDNVNATMFGKLEACILGTGVQSGDLKVMNCTAGKYNEGTISPAETIYFY